jgi:hypothetical protein
MTSNVYVWSADMFCPVCSAKVGQVGCYSLAVAIHGAAISGPVFFFLNF